MASYTTDKDIPDIVQQITQNVTAVHPVSVNGMHISLKTTLFRDGLRFTATVFSASPLLLKMRPLLEGCLSNSKIEAYVNLLAVSRVMLYDLQGSNERERDKIGVYDTEYRGWFYKGPDRRQMADFRGVHGG